MATRRDIREAFYTELESAASSHVPADNIQQDNPEDDEDLPAIVHNDNYRDIPMNRGQGPTDIVTNGNTIMEVTWTNLRQARFTVTIVAADEQTKEDAYRDVVNYFEAFEHPTKDVSSVHSDAFDIEVDDTNSVDATDRDPPMRGDQFTVDLSFKRYHTLLSTDSAKSLTDSVEYVGTFDNIKEIDHLIDADNDGTTDETYTTT